MSNENEIDDDVASSELADLMNEVNQEVNKPIIELQAAPTVEVHREQTEVEQLRSELTEVKILLAKLSETKQQDQTSFIGAFNTMLKEALSQTIPAAGIAINQAQSAANKEELAKRIRHAQSKLKRCVVCGQPESACGGPFARDADGKEIVERAKDGSVKYTPSVNHTLSYVGPRNHRLFKWFQGVIIGGVRYLSDRPGHAIWIPKKSDILTIVNNWENNEEDLLQGRKAEGHGSMGFVGPGQTVNRMDSQAFLGWR